MKSKISADYIKLIHRYAISVKRNELDLIDAVRYEPDIDFLCLKLDFIDNSIERAATALHDVACYHPFVEGNKRTALLLCENLLGDDVYILADELDIFDYVMEVARGDHDVESIVCWLKANTGHLPRSSNETL